MRLACAHQAQPISCMCCMCEEGRGEEDGATCWWQADSWSVTRGSVCVVCRCAATPRPAGNRPAPTKRLLKSCFRSETVLKCNCLNLAEIWPKSGAENIEHLFSLTPCHLAGPKQHTKHVKPRAERTQPKASIRWRLAFVGREFAGQILAKFKCWCIRAAARARTTVAFVANNLSEIDKGEATRQHPSHE